VLLALPLGSLVTASSLSLQNENNVIDLFLFNTSGIVRGELCHTSRRFETLPCSHLKLERMVVSAASLTSGFTGNS